MATLFGLAGVAALFSYDILVGVGVWQDKTVTPAMGGVSFATPSELVWSKDSDCENKLVNGLFLKLRKTKSSKKTSSTTF